jgi:hypothetical protein
MNGQTQSIIVYRNPAEQAFWESGMIVPLGAGALMFLFVMMGMDQLISLKYGWRKPLWTQWLMWVASITASFATMKWLWL